MSMFVKGAIAALSFTAEMAVSEALELFWTDAPPTNPAHSEPVEPTPAPDVIAIDLEDEGFASTDPQIHIVSSDVTTLRAEEDSASKYDTVNNPLR